MCRDLLAATQDLYSLPARVEIEDARRRLDQPRNCRPVVICDGRVQNLRCLQHERLGFRFRRRLEAIRMCRSTRVLAQACVYARVSGAIIDFLRSGFTDDELCSSTMLQELKWQAAAHSPGGVIVPRAIQKASPSSGVDTVATAVTPLSETTRLMQPRLVISLFMLILLLVVDELELVEHESGMLPEFVFDV